MRSNKNLKLMLYPYLFVLKEGPKIQSDYLDYSLLMLRVTSPEIIKSPAALTKSGDQLDSDLSVQEISPPRPSLDSALNRFPT